HRAAVDEDCARMTTRPNHRRIGRAAALLAALVVVALPATPAVAAEGLMDPNPRVQRQIEAALERQDEMVAEAVGKLAPQRPGTRDIYFIGIAGWGDQDVFRLEVRAVRALFEKSFDAAKRAVSL